MKRPRHIEPLPRSHRATHWQLRAERLALARRPLVMGIVNVTPDSFSDGGRFFDSSSAIEEGLRQAAAGADLLDVGGESTRPDSKPVAETEQLRRVLPVVEALATQSSIPISIDTSNAAVAAAAIEAGAQLINDVTALSGDPRMVDVARETGAGVCAMHMQGTPRTMQNNPRYGDVTAEVCQYLGDRRDQLTAAGIRQDRIAVDPGIGFGKTHQHNLTLIAEIEHFHSLGCPLLVGHSRKGFIGKILGKDRQERSYGTLGVSLALAAHGVQILRVHDVQATCDALKLFEASGGLNDNGPR